MRRAADSVHLLEPVNIISCVMFFYLDFRVIVFLLTMFSIITLGWPVVFLCFCHQCSSALFVISKAWNLSNFNMAALRHGSRKFYEIPSSEEFTHLRSKDTLKKEKNVKELFKYIEESCIGEDVTFCGPYGPRKGKFGWPLMYFYW